MYQSDPGHRGRARGLHADRRLADHRAQPGRAGGRVRLPHHGPAPGDRPGGGGRADPGLRQRTATGNPLKSRLYRPRSARRPRAARRARPGARLDLGGPLRGHQHRLRAAGHLDRDVRDTAVEADVDAPCPAARPRPSSAEPTFSGRTASSAGPSRAPQRRAPGSSAEPASLARPSVAGRALEEVVGADEVGDERGARAARTARPARPPAAPCPRSKTAIRSASDMASSWSWVTTTKVMPTSFCSRLSSSCISARTFLSSADSGSSSSSRRGRLTIARASATRCRWPPESCCGLARGRAPSGPTVSSTSPTRC